MLVSIYIRERQISKKNFFRSCFHSNIEELLGHIPCNFCSGELAGLKPGGGATEDGLNPGGGATYNN